MIDNTVKHKLIFKNYQIYQTKAYLKARGCTWCLILNMSKKRGLRDFRDKRPRDISIFLVIMYFLLTPKRTNYCGNL